MAKQPRLSPAEQEVQDYLAQVSAGQAGIDPKAQTLSRSFSNRAAQRYGQRLVDDRLDQNARNAEDAQQEAERAAKEAQKAQEAAQKEAAAAAKAEQARNVRAAAAAGVATTTDIETGRRTIQTHPDGQPVYKVGPVGPVQPIGTQGVALQNPDGTTRALPNTSIMTGGDGAAATTGEPERRTVFAEPIRDDRGNIRQVTPEPKTDKATGFQYVPGTDKSTGLPTKTTVGVDADQRRANQLGEQMQALDLRDNAVKQAQAAFLPRWKPVEEEYGNAKAERERVAKTRFEKVGEAWVKVSEDGTRTPATIEQANTHQKIRQQAEERFSRAQKAYSKDVETAGNLERNVREIAEQRLKLTEEKIRLDSGLPSNDGGVAFTLAEAEAGPSPATQAAAQAADEVIPPEAPKPLTESEALAKAFGSVPGIENVTLQGTDVGYSWLMRDGLSIGRVDNRGGSPVIILKPEATDLQAHIAKAGEGTVPVYLADNASRPTEQENAAWAAGVMQVAAAPAQGPLAEGETQLPEIDRDAELKRMGAGYNDILRRVKEGTLSVRMGEALIEGIYGETMKAPDPTAPETFQKFLASQSPDFQSQWAEANKDRDPAKIDALRGEFISRWYAENQHKPGVTWEQMKQLRGNREARGIGDIAEGMAKGVGGVAVDALGSMGGMIGGTAALIGLTISSPVSDTASDLRKSHSDTLGRAFTNFNRGIETNFKKHLTAEGKARLKPLADSSFELKYLIENRHEIPADQFKSALLAAAAKVGKDAYALHQLNIEEGWAVEPADFDVMQDRALGASLLTYAETGDPAAWEEFQRRLLMDKGSRQADELASVVTAGKGRLAAAFAGGVNAPPQEMMIELLSSVATFGAGKAVGATTNAAIKGGSAGTRLARLRRAMAGISDDFKRFGQFTDTLANPASKGKRLANKAIGLAKANTVEAAGEAVEEGVAGLADPTATAESVAAQAGAGFVGGFILGPLMAIPGAITQGRNERAARMAQSKGFADWYNRENAGTEGFAPLAPQEAEAALAMLDPGEHARLVADQQQALAEFKQATEDVANSQAPGEVGVAGNVQRAWRENAVSRMSRAMSRAAETRAAVANYVGGVVEAAQSTKGMEAPARAKIMGLTKAATGRTDLLTSTERQAIAGLQTKDGAPYFADVNGRTVFTAEGRAEVLADNPLVGGLIQTDESRALIEQAAEAEAQSAAAQGQTETSQPVGAQPAPAVQAQNAAKQAQPTPTNEQNPKGSTGSPAAEEAPQAGQAAGQAPAGSGGGQTAAEAPVEPPASPAAPVGPNPAELDAAEYEALRQTDPTLPDIPTVVANAKAAGRPVSKSMEKAAANAPERAQTPEPVRNRAQRAEIPAVQEAIQRAESRFPAIAGRFIVDETSKAKGSGGAYMLGGKIVINLADARLDLEGYDVDAIPARLDAVLEEEIIHLAQLEATNRLGEPMDRFYAALWNEFSPAQQRAAEDTYATIDEETRQRKGRPKTAWETLLPWQKAAEATRMLIQHRMDGRVTELTKAFSRNMPERLIALLKSAVEFLREVVATGKIPERVQQAMDAIEGILAEFEGKDPSTDRDATQEIAVPSSLRLIGDAIRDARNADPRLTAKRARELEFAVEDLDAVLETMPEDQRRPFIDSAIADWLDSMPAEPDPEAAPQPEAKPKTPRKNPYRKKALELIYSGDYKYISAIHEYGKLERNPPIIGLILNRKANAKKLTENEMARMRAKFDGMPTQAMFQGYGPKGRLAAEVLSILTVPYGQGNTADQVASGISDGWTPVELFAELTDELMQITRGERFKNQELDPNREWTDEEIAADMERQAREAIEDAEREAIDNEYDGEVAPSFVDDDGEILFASPAPAAFYSRLSSAIESAEFGTSKAKAPGHWAGVILKWAQGRSSAGGALWNKGISKEELKWSGIMTWLESQKRPLTKAEVLDWLANEGAVRFEEVSSDARKWEVSDDNTTEYFATREEAESAAEDWIDNVISGADLPGVYQIAENWEVEQGEDWDGNPDGWVVRDDLGEALKQFDDKDDADAYLDLWKSRWFIDKNPWDNSGFSAFDYDLGDGYDSEAEAIEARNQEARENSGVVVREAREDGMGLGKFSQYTLPGGENYREVVLAMPPKQTPYTEWEIVRKDDGKTISGGIPTKEDADRLLASTPQGEFYLREIQRTKKEQASYTSTHFPDVPNYVAHMRTNERVDADGKRGLFIEEIQSDRHQAGRKKGYALKPGEVPSQAYAKEFFGITDADWSAMPEQQRQSYVDEIVEGGKHLKGGVADAPFRKDWPLAMFKRALRDAVAGGAEWIGWTTGTTQNDRFDLSKQVDHIDYRKKGDRFELAVVSKDGDAVDLPKPDYSADELEDVVGKEVAQKIVNGEGQPGGGRMTLRGVDLKVGGSGMKGFYDNMLPKEIGKYVKQWGGKVEKAKVADSDALETESFADFMARTGLSDTEARPRYMQERRRVAPDGIPIWRIEITPEMRAGVEMGQALFSSRSGQGSFDFGTSASFDTRKGQMGFDFAAPAAPAAPAPQAEATPAPATPAVGRSKPKQLVTFAKPITGPSGASLTAYEWKYELQEELDSRGELVGVRVSNWNEAAESADTGREVVHQFYVEGKDGRSQIVSLESALKLMGYTSGKDAVPIKSLASVLKTRARNQMELDQLESQLAAFEAARERLKPVVNALPLPPVTLDADRSAMGARYRMGDEWQVAQTEQEAVKLMEPRWRQRQMAQRMGDAWISNEARHDEKIADLKTRIKKADKKIAEAAAAASVDVNQPAADAPQAQEARTGEKQGARKLSFEQFREASAADVDFPRTLAPRMRDKLAFAQELQKDVGQVADLDDALSKVAAKYRTAMTDANAEAADRVIYDAATRAGLIESAKPVTAGQLAGPRIDDEWHAFNPASGTLGIPRAEMPQVKAEDRSALVQFLRARGVDYATEEVLPGSLKPTQAEYSPKKVTKARTYEGGNRSILVSSDNHVVDGHHQWMAALADTPKERMQVIRLKAPIRELLPMVLEMPSAESSGTTARRPVQGGLTLGLSVTGKAQGGFDFDAPAKTAAPAPAEPQAPATPAAPRPTPASPSLTDFGEKLGGARKDLATKGEASPRTKKTNDKPGWFNRYEVAEVVSEMKPSTPLEAIIARQSGNAESMAGRFVIYDKRKTDWRGNPERATRQSFATREEAEAFIPVVEVGRNHRVRSEKVGESYRYAIWRDVTDRKRVQVVPQTFDTDKEALAYMVANAKEIIETKTSWREELIAKPEVAVRKGPDRRSGPATPEMFQQAFGFRGVEFGNWMRQAGDGKERQEVLNHAYDGLLDLADLLGIPPRAISLNGDLGLAFGARGQGLSGAKAHYEPDYVVINLTKMSGAGSLAHEWIHALDHYLGRQDGRASSEWVKNQLGDMTLKGGAPETRMVSHGFGRTSGVREEVRKAFAALLDQIMTKAVEYVEDSNKAESFVGAARKALEDHLASMRKDYTRTPDPRWEKRRKVATTAQLALFDSIADRLINGQDLETEWRMIEGGQSKYGNARWTSDVLEQLGVLHKAITNRSGFSKERGGPLDSLRGYMSRYADRIKMLESAAASETKVRKVPTDFSMNAKRIDQGSASDYWNTPHEMLARAFSAYVEDRIAEKGGTSDFLSYGSDNNLPSYRLFNLKPFPEGAEREVINKAFDNLFAVLDTKETERGVALFSSPTQPDLFAATAAPDAQAKLGSVKIGSKNALGAYRALTAKRAAGKALTPEEEETLLQAETALGQKMAFDMQAVTGTAPAVDKEPLTTQTAQIAPLEGVTRAKIESELKAGERTGNFSLVTDAKVRLSILTGDPEIIHKTLLEEMGIRAPVRRDGNDLLLEVITSQSMAALMRTLRGSFPVLAAMTPEGRQAIKIIGVPEQIAKPAPKRQKDIQQTLGLGGEVLKDGQMTLFSSPVRALLNSDFAKPPADHTFQPSDEADRPYIQEALAEFGLAGQSSSALEAGTRRFEALTGTKVAYYRGGEGSVSAFTPPSRPNLILVNADGTDPLIASLAHELTHVAQKDSRTDATAIYRLALDHLSQGEYQHALGSLIRRGYKPESAATEFPAYLVGDAISGANVFGLEEFARARELKAAILDWFDNLPLLNPSALKDATDDELSRLASSPTPESQAAVEQALEKMPPIYRAVFQAVSDGMDEAATAQKFGISAKAVTNILNAVRSRITVATRAASGTLQPAMRDGKFDGGRPDLAEGAKPDFVAVDQIRNDSNIPGEYSRDESRAEATRRLDADYEAEFDRLFRMINENRPPNDVDVAMAKEIFRRETMSGGLDDPARRVKVALFRVAYRDMGSAQSRAFSMRIDEEMTPAERHALHLTELLYEPSPDVKARLKKADPATKESILKKWMAQIDAFKAEMAAQGLDIDAAIRAFNQREEANRKAMEESPRVAAAYEETFEKLTKREKLVIQAIRSGAKLSGIVAQTGFTREEVLEIHRRFETGWRAAMAAAAKRFLEASLAASPSGDVMGQIMADLGWQSIDDLDDLDPAYEQKQELKRKEAEAIRKVRQQRTKPKPKEKPAFVTTPQQEARWKALADLWRNSPLSTWRTLWETEMRNLGPIFGVSFERARDEFLAPWRALWQTEMDLRPQDGRMTFEEWMERPETREKWKKQPELFAEPINERTGDWNETRPLPMTGQAELNRAPINETTGPNEKKTAVGQGNLGLFPINETTGTFDINDPRPMAYLANEWARRNGTWINKAIEWFKMSILSGLQTIAINAMGGLHVAYTVGPRRAIEAAWNDLLKLFGAGDVRSATLSEFLPMLKHVRASMRLAANQGIRAWQLESPVFESYAEGKPVQLEFSGVGPEFSPPALATATWNELVNDKSFKNAIGFVNRFMRNITFRELTATDEFWKGLYAQLDVAAIAHRIAAKEENLTGDAYAKRTAELMKPGSVAWSRVIPRTKTATFQDRLAYGEWTKEDEKKNPAHRAGTSMTWQQAFEKSQTESAWTILDAFGALAMDARKLPMIGPILHMFALPFIITPKNLIQRGLEVTPLGLVVDLIDGMRSFRRRIHSGRITAEESRRIAGELYNKARFIQLLTNQSIGLMAYLALEGLSEGDEDDEYGRPHITGTMPWTTTKRGEIDIANEVMPPQSIRIGDTIIPYKRFDPFSTIAASLVDMGVSLRRNDGQFNGQAVTDLVVSLKEQTKDKLFLKGLGDIIRVVEDPHRGADRLAAGYVTGFVPNLIRQPIRETDSVQRDKNPMADAGFFEAVAQRVGYDLFPRTAPAKIDIWGDPVPANRGELLAGSKPLDAAFRVIDPTNATFGGKVRPISAWIYRYNMMQPDSSDRIGIQPYPGEISVTFPGQPRPVKVPLTPAEVEEANRNIGQMAVAMLGEDWDWRTANAPDARQRAELIADTFTNLRRAETQRLKLKKLAEGPPKE